MSPELIHQKGIDEVARITSRIQSEVFKPLGHTGSIHQLGQQLRSDPKQQFADKDALVVGFNGVLEKIQTYLPSLFEKMLQSDRNPPSPHTWYT